MITTDVESKVILGSFDVIDPKWSIYGMHIGLLFPHTVKDFHGTWSHKGAWVRVHIWPNIYGVKVHLGVISCHWPKMVNICIHFVGLMGCCFHKLWWILIGLWHNGGFGKGTHVIPTDGGSKVIKGSLTHNCQCIMGCFFHILWWIFMGLGHKDAFGYTCDPKHVGSKVI